jgi:hypothetical protein
MKCCPKERQVLIPIKKKLMAQKKNTIGTPQKKGQA